MQKAFGQVAKIATTNLREYSINFATHDGKHLIGAILA
jgi:hypothetical protein